MTNPLDWLDWTEVAATLLALGTICLVVSVYGRIADRITTAGTPPLR